MYAQPQYQQVQYGPPIGIGQPSFLRGAMQTAAGVAAGALAFEGVEAVLHGLGGFGHPGMGYGGVGMGGFGMGSSFERPQETVINNYYDDPRGGHEGMKRGEERHFHDSSDQFANQGGAQFSDASYQTGDDNFGNQDNSNFDDSSNFDNSGGDMGFDDGGGGDSGGGGDLL